MKRKRCKYGKLKKRIGNRRCKKARRAPARKGRAKRAKRSKRRYVKAAGIGLGTIGVLAGVAFGTYKLLESQNA